MSMTFIGWLFVTLAIPVLLHFLMGTRGLRKEQPDVETCKASLEDIGARQKKGALTDAEADAARIALFSRSPSPGRRFRKSKLLLASSVILLVSGLGAAVSYDRSSPETMRPAEMIPFSEPDGELLAQLTGYAGSIGTEQPSSAAPTGEFLPDVNAMIERLAARLESTPQDLAGWRMLGWSYLQTERYEQAAAAFGKALELDPGSAELRLSYEESRAKAADGKSPRIASSFQAGTIDDGSGGGHIAATEVMSGADRDVAIRSMVEGLANRLEASPRDVEGWIHLMRSRVVLGEADLAAATFRKARAVFVGDMAASSQIKAAAAGLGLKVE